MIKIRVKKGQNKASVTLVFETGRVRKRIKEARERFFALQKMGSTLFFAFIALCVIGWHNFWHNLRAYFSWKLKAFQLALKVLRARPEGRELNQRQLSLFSQKEPRELALERVKKEIGKLDIKKFSQIAGFLAVLALLLQISLFLQSLTLPEYAKADEQLCPVNADVVLVMDVSNSMEDGAALSKCEWTEMRQVPGEGYYTWFLNVKYDVTEEWCLNVRDSYDETSIHYSYQEPTYTPARNSKITDAKAAANSFLDNLKETDFSALISFNSSASSMKSLSNDHQATKDAVEGLATGGYTNLGDALLAAKGELDEGRSATTTSKTIILLTDGRANRPNGWGSESYQNSQDEDYARQVAQQIAQAGYRVYPLGFGIDVNSSLLQDIANTTGGSYYFEPTDENLTQIYSEISQGHCQYGSISGCKYQDANNNGQIDEGEEKLSGWEILLSGDATSTQITDEQGCFTFAGLEAGHYVVSEGPNPDKEPFNLTYPESQTYEIDLAQGENIANLDFGNYLPVCGNGIVDTDFGEICEIGNSQVCTTNDGYSGSQACNESCSGWQECVTEEFCGDGTKNGPEECDDGNTVSGDGCSATCEIEAAGGGQGEEPVCGNEIVEQGEQCDGDAPQSCVTADGYSGTQSCVDCSWGECETDEFCGDGTVQGPEKCDDGNTNNGDGCSSECAVEGADEITSQEACEALDYYWYDNACHENPASSGGSGTEGGGTGSSGTGGGGGGSVPVGPAISEESITATNITENKVTIKWLTSFFSSSQVIYAAEGEAHTLDMTDNSGTPPKYGYAKTTPEYDTNGNKVTFHTVVISDLSPGTLYYFRTVSRASPPKISDEHTFNTLGQKITLSGGKKKKEEKSEEGGGKNAGKETSKGKRTLEEIEKELKEISSQTEEISKKVVLLRQKAGLPTEGVPGGPVFVEKGAGETAPKKEAIVEKPAEKEKKPEELVIGKEGVAEKGPEEAETKPLSPEKKGFLAAIGAMSLTAKSLVITLGVIALLALGFWLLLSRKKREKARAQ